jgi:hypothetical protein
MQVGEACYKFNITEASWDDAAASCIEEDGHLVYINDNDENRLVHGKSEKKCESP